MKVLPFLFRVLGMFFVVNGLALILQMSPPQIAASYPFLMLGSGLLLWMLGE